MVTERAAIGLDVESSDSKVAALSPSVYDIAAVSLVPGPQQASCVEWLLRNRATTTTWGAPSAVNWYDAYLSTYAAAVAMREATWPELADRALGALSSLVPAKSSRVMETLTFGGLVEALDQYGGHRGWPVPAHPPAVRVIVDREAAKWRRMRTWDRFLDPDWSIAGYCAERVFGDTDVDLGAFLAAFQTSNGSIANAPGASALFFLELQRRNEPVAAERVERLRGYLHTRSAPEIGYLDWVPHFTTSWTVMFEHELGGVPDVPPAAADLFRADLNHPSGLMGSVGTVGDTTIPGDADNTACAMLAAWVLDLPAPSSEAKLDLLYDHDQGCYRTFLFEHDPSLSTNIHVAAVLALENRADRLTQVLEWLTDAVTREGTTLCKWHLSPIYAMGELARVAARIDHPLATDLHVTAIERLLLLRNADGGWGVHGSTAEETGYAVLGLAAASATVGATGPVPDALRRAHHYLTAHPPREVPLWLGKTLYCLRTLVPVLHRTALERIEQLALV
ncbi:hypothetical protein [Allokutzneria sp. NRRL B-24872]|uniref:hypothetical protein n=1 Tax=Allokutzneria sp. NRRL B-24872 TaxID=1137961 RepID=UPI000A3A9565|nr:hypothetical protein [Allokutzneria sp. NRRL B-24872]